MQPAYWLEVRKPVQTSPFSFTMDYSLIGGLLPELLFNIL
jgi:hypothetical protein